MPNSKATSRRNEDIKREIIAIVSDMKDPNLQQGMLTITRAEVAPDLSTAKVYVSVLGEDKNATATAVEALNRAKGHVRSQIAQRMQHIRRAPELTFVIDDNAAYAAHINDLLNNLK